MAPKDKQKNQQAWDQLLDTIKDRRETFNQTGKGTDKSYVTQLFAGGPKAISAKILEEAQELAEALQNESDTQVIHEASDLVFHLLVGLGLRDLEWRGILEELARRQGQSGLQEKANRKPSKK